MHPELLGDEMTVRSRIDVLDHRITPVLGESRGPDDDSPAVSSTVTPLGDEPLGCGPSPRLEPGGVGTGKLHDQRTISGPSELVDGRQVDTAPPVDVPGSIRGELKVMRAISLGQPRQCPRFEVDHCVVDVVGILIGIEPEAADSNRASRLVGGKDTLAWRSDVARGRNELGRVFRHVGKHDEGEKREEGEARRLQEPELRRKVTDLAEACAVQPPLQQLEPPPQLPTA